MPNDFLTMVLRRADELDPVLIADELRVWPAEICNTLLSSGVLTETELSKAVRCNSCGGDHLEEVVRVDLPGRPTRWFIPCPVDMRVSIHPDRLRRWKIGFCQIAHQVAREFGIAGGVVEQVPGRVWRLGKLTLDGKVWSVFLARGLSRADGESIVARESGLVAANAVVLVPGELPPRSVWGSGRTPVVVRLADLLSLRDGILVADRVFLASCCGSSSPATPHATFPTPAGTTWDQVTLTVGDRTLTIAVGDMVRRLTHAEAGFADRKANGKPDRMWAFLEATARNSGVIPSRNGGGGVAPDIRQAVSDLRGRLRSLLGLESDPFPHNRKTGEYRAAFRLRLEGPPKFLLPTGSGWGGVAFTELANGQIEVSCDGSDHADGMDFEDVDGQELRKSLAGTQTSNWTRLVPLSAFGPTVDGVPPAEVTALLAVLRGGGSVRGKMADAAFLKLGKVLTTMFQTDKPALDYHKGHWIALFGAESLAEAER